MCMTYKMSRIEWKSSPLNERCQLELILVCGDDDMCRLWGRGGGLSVHMVVGSVELGCLYAHPAKVTVGTASR